jgi:hypothetical protein
MATEALWAFYGFQTAAQNKPIQRWFDGRDDDVRDEIRDSLLYHENVERHLWKRPAFDELGGEGISEFRFKVSGTAYRMYGDFRPRRHEYTFLHADVKTADNDKPGKRIAKDRNGQLDRKEASVHVFRWKEDAD